MNDGENLDVDSLVRSLNQIAEKENDEIIAHVDKLYDKTVTLASPRLMKESNLDFTHQGALLRTPNGPAVSLTKSSPTPISSSISTEEMTLADVSICLDDLVTQVEKVERPERDKVQHETLLLYCKRLQHQQLEYKKQIKELTFERNYSLQAFDTVVAEYEILKAEAKAYDDLLKSNEEYSKQVVDLIKHNRQLQQEKEDLISIIKEGISIEELELENKGKAEIKTNFKRLVKEKIDSFDVMRKLL